MFTGIVEHRGRVRSTLRTASGLRLVIDPAGWSRRHTAGDSVAVNGCCLTVVTDPGEVGGDLTFDVIPETLTKTTLAAFAPGDEANLEQAATMGTLLGGHVVQGHVDGVGEVLSVQQLESSGGAAAARLPVSEADWIAAAQCRIRIRPGAQILPYLVPKGSIAVDGVSLTIAAIDVAGGWFEVALIPTTLDRTTLARLRPGSRCNLEADAMAKTVVHYLRHFLDAGRGTQPQAS